MKKIALGFLLVASGVVVAKDFSRPPPLDVDVDSYGLCEACALVKDRASEAGRGVELRAPASGFVMSQFAPPYTGSRICTSINQAAAGQPVDVLSGTFSTGANTDVEVIVNAEGRLARRPGLPSDGTTGMGSLVVRFQVWRADEAEPPIQILPVAADIYTRFVIQSSLRDGYIISGNELDQRHQPAITPISISRIVQGLSPNANYRFRLLSWWGNGNTGMILDPVSVNQSGGPRGATICTPTVSIKQFRP